MCCELLFEQRNTVLCIFFQPAFIVKMILFNYVMVEGYIFAVM